MFNEIIVIASFNEKESLRSILKKISKKYKIVVIDDGSIDSTTKFLRSKKIEFISNKRNLGYEKSLIKVIQYVIKKYPNTKNLITFDADGEHKTTDLEAILKFCKSQNPNLLICNRKNIIRFSEKIVNFFFKLKFNIEDPLSGLKVYDLKILRKYIKEIKTRYFFVDLASNICRNNHKVLNFPIKCKIIKNRKARVGNSIFTNIKILKTLLII